MRHATLSAVLLAAGATLAYGTVLAHDRDGHRRDRDRCDDSRDLAIVNGRIITMDERNPVVSSVTIQNGRIVAVGHDGDHERGPCTRVIDVGGRTVIPGLIDNHNHIVQAGHRPGHDNRLDTAFSIADVQAVIRKRTLDVPKGEWINAVGGWNPNQFAEKRLPTLAELDAAAPTNPVYLQVAFAGPSATNSAGRSLLQSQGVTVDANGQIASGAQSQLAFFYLRSQQTFEDRKRGALDVTSWAAGLGLTTVLDAGSNPATNTPADNSINLDQATQYDPFIALAKEDKLPLRLRITFLSRDPTADLPLLTARLNNAFVEFGNDMVRTTGIGEHISLGVGNGVPPVPYAQAARVVAGKGYIHTQHTLDLLAAQSITGIWEDINATIPLQNLHWALQHVPAVDPATVDRLKAMNAGIAAHGFRVLGGTPTSNGPPFRMLIDSGIHVGGGSDGANIAPINPWMIIYYMVTGKNNAGILINAGQTITRMEALRLYTEAQGWFLKEEDDLGSIEIGKFGDLTVLSKDFLDPRKVSDEDIRFMSSVLTIVGGKVVHDAGAVDHHR
jgi:hypothetical protein